MPINMADFNDFSTFTCLFRFSSPETLENDSGVLSEAYRWILCSLTQSACFFTRLNGQKYREILDFRPYLPQFWTICATETEVGLHLTPQSSYQNGRKRFIKVSSSIHKEFRGSRCQTYPYFGRTDGPKLRQIWSEIMDFSIFLIIQGS